MAGSETNTDARLDELGRRLEQIFHVVNDLAGRARPKAWYTTADVAAVVSRAEYTVREWARQGRIRAEKRASGRGSHRAWVVSHEELMRYQRDGLLPPTGQGSSASTPHPDGASAE